MARKQPIVSPEELAEAEAKAAEDAKLLEQLADQGPQEPQSQTPTLADRMVGMAELLVRVRQHTRLSESTLTKLLELALNYHVWQTQRDEQTKPFDPTRYMDGGDSTPEPVLPVPDEYIGEAPSDNVISLPVPDSGEEI